MIECGRIAHLGKCKQLKYAVNRHCIHGAQISQIEGRAHRVLVFKGDNCIESIDVPYW